MDCQGLVMIMMHTTAYLDWHVTTHACAHVSGHHGRITVATGNASGCLFVWVQLRPCIDLLLCITITIVTLNRALLIVSCPARIGGLDAAVASMGVLRVAYSRLRKVLAFHLQIFQLKSRLIVRSDLALPGATTDNLTEGRAVHDPGCSAWPRHSPRRIRCHHPRKGSTCKSLFLPGVFQPLEHMRRRARRDIF